MKIGEQVLNISQVQKLIELGFNVRKHSSIYYVPNWVIKWGEDEIQDYDLVIGELREEDIDCIPTLTIGDIIEVLPENIDNNFFLMFEKDYVAYNNRYLVLMSKEEKNLITALFECLVWCIKQKHIDL